MPMGLSLRTIFRPTILLAIGLMAVIVMMILPVPAWMLDLAEEVRVVCRILAVRQADRPNEFRI